MDETRTLYSADGWVVEATMTPDLDVHAPDGDCYSQRDYELYGATWSYVGIIVNVQLNGVTIGEDQLWGVEHGQLSDVEADAFELTPPEYGRTDDGTPTVTMGSPLSGVVIEAIDQAGKWLQSINARPDRASFDKMARTFDPHGSDVVFIAPAEVSE